jgi:hypothetical protein
VDEVKEADRDVAEAVRKIYDEGQEQIERDKKNFRSGSEERQRKVWQMLIAQNSLARYPNLLSE